MAAAPHTLAAISSADNSLVKNLRRLTGQATAYRKLGQFWISGDHLCRAALARGCQPAVVCYAETFFASAKPDMSHLAVTRVVLADRLFALVNGMESSAGMGFLMDLPAAMMVRPGCDGRSGPHSRRRQCRLHPAQRGSVRVSPSRRHQGHGGDVVAQGTACRHGGPFWSGTGRVGGLSRDEEAAGAPGRHQLARRGSGTAGPAALALRLGVRA